jgi:hypothetical protein
MGAIQAGPAAANLEPGEMMLLPTAIALHGVGTDQFGRHVLNVSIDNGAAEREVVFWVLHLQERGLPPMA